MTNRPTHHLRMALGATAALSVLIVAVLAYGLGQLLDEQGPDELGGVWA